MGAVHGSLHESHEDVKAVMLLKAVLAVTVVLLSDAMPSYWVTHHASQRSDARRILDRRSVRPTR